MYVLEVKVECLLKPLSKFTMWRNNLEALLAQQQYAIEKVELVYTCRNKLHDDESRLIQGVLMITKMMTKSPRKMSSRLSQEHFKYQEKFDFKFQESRIKNNQVEDSRIKKRLNQDKY